MRKLYLIALSLYTSYASSQVFNGTGGTIQNTGTETYFNLNVSGLPYNLSSSFGIEEVTIDITHATVEELYIYLRSPNGRKVELSAGASCKGANYTSTTFNSGLGNSITLGTAPYTGSFQPVGYLGRFNTNVDGNGNWTLIIKDYFAGGNSGTLNSWSIKFGNTPAAPVTFTSSNLPIVFINTANQTISENEIMVDLGIIDNGNARNNITDPLNGYNGKTMIKVRGSSSKIFEKKSYKIDLVDGVGQVLNAGLLGMPMESDWVLTASYTDKTFIRNPLANEIFRQMGHYASRSRYVELILNNEYMGIYILSEKPKRNANRINISKMGELDNGFPYVTGGYILQIDRTDEPGWYSLLPGNSPNNIKFYYQYNYPKPDVISAQQKAYIKAVMDTFEMVMDGPSFADPNIGFRKYADELSFIDMFIVNEFSKNADGYKLSTYLYKDNWYEGGKLHVGPVWDYDIAWHNCNYGNTASEQWWQYDQPNIEYPIPTWWTRLMQDQAFKDRIYCRWHTLRMGSLSNAALNAYIDKCANELYEATERNFQQFPVLNAYIFPNTPEQIGTSYWGMVDDLKSWISKRGTWLDQNMPGFCNNVSVTDQLADNETIDAYPNPFSGDLTLLFHNNQQAKVNLKLLDMSGRLVQDLDLNSQGNGAQYASIKTDHLPAGTYIVRLTMDNKVHNKKLVKIQ